VLRTLVLGQAVIALGLAAASAAPSYWILAALMMAAGAGYGMLNPTSTKAVIAWFPPAQRATAVGLKQVGLPLGGALGAAFMPPLALAIGWRAAVVLSGGLMSAGIVATLALYRDPAAVPVARAAPLRPSLGAVLTTRDLWLVAASTLVFAAVQTVWMAFLVLYLQEIVGLSLLVAGRLLAAAQVAGMAGRAVFGLLSDRAFGGRRRPPLALAGIGSALCSLAIAATGPGSSLAGLALLALAFGFVGIGWNGVQHTLMAELAGPDAAGTALGLGLAVSSLGVTLGPPLFGYAVELAGGYRGPWIGLAVTMAAALAVLALVRERPRLP
jgi:predicted MFS family arabinose efflux permease